MTLHTPGTTTIQRDVYSCICLWVIDLTEARDSTLYKDLRPVAGSLIRDKHAPLPLTDTVAPWHSDGSVSRKSETGRAVALCCQRASYARPSQCSTSGARRPKSDLHNINARSHHGVDAARLHIRVRTAGSIHDQSPQPIRRDSLLPARDEHLHAR